MKPFTKYCLSFLILSFPLFYSCSNHSSNGNSGLKVVLDLSYKEYIKSLVTTNHDTLFDNVLANTSSTKMQYKPFFESFIDNYIRRASLQQLLHNFWGNAEMPPLHTKNELLYFLTTDFNIKMNRMDMVLKNRIKAFTDVSLNDVRITHEQKQIVIFISGLENSKVLAPVFKNREGIQFWEIVDPKMATPFISQLSDSLHKPKPLKKIQVKDTHNIHLDEMLAEGEQKSEGLDALISPLVDATGKFQSETAWAVIAISDTAKFTSMVNQPLCKHIFPPDFKFMYGALTGMKENDRKKFATIFIIKTAPNNQPLLNNDDIKEAKDSYSFDKPEVSMSMTPKGTIKWANATQKCLNRGIAIELGGYVYSYPVVLSKISGGKSSLTGDYPEDEMKDFTKFISSGRFPLTFNVASIDEVK